MQLTPFRSIVILAVVGTALAQVSNGPRNGTIPSVEITARNAIRL